MFPLYLLFAKPWAWGWIEKGADLIPSGSEHGQGSTGAITPVSSSTQAGIIYYSQEKYFRHVQRAAAVGLEKFSNDPVLQFFKAYGVLREGKDGALLAFCPRHSPSADLDLAVPGYLLTVTQINPHKPVQCVCS